MKNWKAYLAVVMLAALVYFVAFHTHRFLHDFWPLDASAIAPNIVASMVQYALLLILAALLYPPIRRAVDRYVRRHVDELKDHVTTEHRKVHDKLNHIIDHHPDIPPYEET